MQSKINPALDTIVHGTYRAYNRQMCRCEDCREACRAHVAAYRLRKFGDRTLTDINEYRALHYRLARVRGKASLRICAFCGDQAAEWALNHDSSAIKRDVFGGIAFTWSEDLDDYRPLCVPCHRRYDLGLRTSGRMNRSCRNLSPRTQCANGHDITTPGALRLSETTGRTECIECARNRVRRYRERRHAEKNPAAVRGSV